VSSVQESWGGAVRLCLDFAQRPQHVSNARRLIADLCDAALGPGAEASNWVMVSQELLENLAKYSAPGNSELDFELALRDGKPSGQLKTRNAASEQRLSQAAALLGRITQTDDPSALYDELVASSESPRRSQLGLIRVRAEAGLELRYALSGAWLEIVVSGAVTPREANS
jgi:hypothetical protein